MYPKLRKIKPNDVLVCRENFEEDDIIEANMYFVPKSRLRKYVFASMNITEEELKRESIRVWNNKDALFLPEQKNRPFVQRKLVYTDSNRLPEQSINLLIERKELESLSTAVFRYENGQCKIVSSFDQVKYNTLLNHFVSAAS